MMTPSFSIRRVHWVVRSSGTFGRTHPFSRRRVRETLGHYAMKALWQFVEHSRLHARIFLGLLGNKETKELGNQVCFSTHSAKNMKLGRLPNIIFLQSFKETFKTNFLCFTFPSPYLKCKTFKKCKKGKCLLKYKSLPQVQFVVLCFLTWRSE